MEKPGDRLGRGADRIFHREHGVFGHFAELADEGEVPRAVGRDFRAILLEALEPDAVGVGQQDRNADRAAHDARLVALEAELADALLKNLLAAASSDGFFHKVAGPIRVPVPVVTEAESPADLDIVR